jgi:hypothetical protein
MAALKERGVPSRPYFSPIHLQTFYREKFGYQEGDFPMTESVAHSTLALPFSGNMSEEQVDIVCTALQETVIAAANKLYDKEKPVRAVDRNQTFEVYKSTFAQKLTLQAKRIL